MEHVRLIDSLRGFAALLVLLSHVAFWTGASNIDVVGRWLARGDSGVAIFFAISAFLLLSPAYVKAFDLGSSRERDWKTYAYRRAARILPAYWLALAAVLAVGALLPTPDGVGGLRKVVIHLFVGQALFVEQYQGFSQTWSLTTEVTFYVLVPVLSWLIVRSSRRRANPVQSALISLILFAGAGLLTQSAALMLAEAGHHRWAAALGTSALGHSAWFAAGAFVAVLIQAEQQGILNEENGRIASACCWIRNQSRSTLLILALAVFAIAGTPLAGPHDLSAPHLGEVLIKESLYAVLALLLLLVAAKPISLGSALDGYANSGVNEWLGNTSYGVFLWHLVVLQVVFMLTDATLFSAHFGWTLQFVVTITAMVATVSWLFVEKPILQFVRKRTTSGRASKP